MLWISVLGLLSQCPTDFGFLRPRFHLFQGIKNLLISSLISLLTHSLFNNMLFSFQVFAHFSVFFLWLISGFIALRSDKMLDMISIFLNLLRFILCPDMWSILENIPYALEKYIYSAIWGWNALKISIKSIWSSVPFKAAISFLIFCLEDLPVEIIRVLTCLTMTAFLLISPFMSMKICFTYSCPPMMGVEMFTRVISSCQIAPFIVM